MAKSKRTADDTKPAPKLDIPLVTDDKAPGSLAYWADELTRSEEALKPLISEWKKDLATYEGKRPTIRGMDDADVFAVNVPFYVTEQKKPNLVFTTPYVQVSALQPGLENAAPQVQAIINDFLGPQEIDAEVLLDEVCSDLLVTAGFSPTKIGHDIVRVPVQVPRMTTTQTADGPISAPAQDADGKPIFDNALRTVYSKLYWKRISPENFRKPAGFTSVQFDEAPWLGWLFPISNESLKDAGVDGRSASTVTASMSLKTDKDVDALSDLPMACEIWYKAHLYDPTVVNPLLYRQLVFIPGKKGRGGSDHSVLLHRDSPYQQFDPDGKFLGGMVGNPLHVFWIRVTPERAFSQSDARVLRDVTLEKTSGRSQMVQQRRHNVPMVAMNKAAQDKDTIDQFKKGKVQRLVLVNGDPQKVIAAVDRASFPPENFSFDQHTQADIDRLAASGANQQGLANQQADTATEAGFIQRAYETRLAKERARILGTFTKGVYKLFALMQLFCDAEQVTEILGDDGASKLFQWNKETIQGRYGFKLKPDSSLRNNAAEEQDRTLRIVNLLANVPGANTTEMAKWAISKFGENPARLVSDPPPPPPKDNVSVSVSINPALDLNPNAPHYPNVLILLEKAGLQGLAPQQGGDVSALRGAPPIDKHDSERTGNMPGTGPL